MIKEKRKDLTRFIRNQIIGPGATGFRYVDTEDDNTVNKDLKISNAGHYQNELINSVPGALYSSGILFPEDRSETARSEVENLEDEDDQEGSGFNDDPDIEEEDSLSINQMYPNIMGLTCCLGAGVRTDNDVKITLLARYYEKIERKSVEDRYGLLLEQDYDEFNRILSELDAGGPLRTNLDIKHYGPNYILTCKGLSGEVISDVRKELREIDLSKAQELGSDKNDQPLSGYKEFLFKQLKNTTFDEKSKNQLYQTIISIESIENFIAHIKDLISIHDSRGYGLWRSIPLSKTINLPEPVPNNIKGKRIYSSNKHQSLNKIFHFVLTDDLQASLSLNIQLSKNTRQQDEKTFIKVQVQNSSSPYQQSADDNRYFSVFNELVNQRMFFGVCLEVQSAYLVPYKELNLKLDEQTFGEDQVNQFIYRQFEDYAIGHGCSVNWNINNDDKKVSTEYIPEFDTPDVDPIPKDKRHSNETFEPKEIFQDNRYMQFKWLSTLSDATNPEVIKGLESFVKAYENWINIKRSVKHDKNESNIRVQELDKCQKDADRMLENIRAILTDEDQNLEAFRLMNTAMFMQLWHSVKKHHSGDLINEEEFGGFTRYFYKNCDDRLFGDSSAAWRPFQLAFILLNLDGIFKRNDDPKWTARNSLVDLVWFPTGGGKTEAYLGLIALTIIHRRRTYGAVGGGTSVFMRYTLRLLTLQQFQRATLLIMALELMRRWNMFNLGAEPIYIGLWVGKGTLPNKIEELQEEYQKLRDGNEHNKIPFAHCPWCGSKLVPSTAVESDHKDLYNFNRLHLNCSSPKCAFSLPRPRLRNDLHGPIPVSLSDEEIYFHPPALLFGTVDKFAQLAHRVSNDSNSRKNDSRRLFGRGNWESGKPTGYLTPDLIIQDELHLLLGPLGSAVALFESAIERLCTRIENDLTIRPKVVSSTATTRNTDLQIMALFDRKVNLFPKPGIECDDSFFSFYKRTFINGNVDKPSYVSKRKYMGFFPTGRTQIWMQMRLAAILLTHRAIFELKYVGQNSILDSSSYSDSLLQAIDYYHSIVSYFNSLREVGKTQSQVQTYILKEIRKVFHRVVRPGQLMDPIYTYSIKDGELTGRLSGEEVKSELDKVSTSLSPIHRFAHILDSKERTGTSPPEFIVATNMISVGIDVSRFNCIIMNSMPRNIAEYIQASSRVARDKEGLVLTVHHPFRARDVSHYEKFIEFHEKMYSYVEPISITPFTKKALDRYLGLYVATIIRHMIPQFADRNSASEIANLDQNEINDIVRRLTEYFERREQLLSQLDISDQIKNLLKPENLVNITDWAHSAITEWRAKGIKVQDDSGQLVFNNKASKVTNQEQLYIDVDEYQDNFESDKWQIPQSLRVIEPEAVVKIFPK